MTSRSFRITGMTCRACVGRVTAALKSVTGVVDATVTLVPPRAEVQTKNGVDEGDLRKAVSQAGPYTIESQPGDSAHATSQTIETDPALPSDKPSFYPLLLVIGYICGVAAISQLARSAWSWHAFMTDFMAGFFLVFSFFKLLDLRGFADAYRSYDVVARAWRPWGFLYPFVELALGIAYLARWNPPATNITTVVVMLIGSVGVLRALLSRTSIRCACLGTAIKLPMTTVTLIEDLGMAAMAIAMLALGPSASA